MAPTTSRSSFAAIALLSTLAACRDGGAADTASGAPIATSTAGANGCSGPDQTFTVGQTPVDVTPAGVVFTASNRICAGRGAEILYATAGGSVVALDASIDPPASVVLCSAAAVDALLAGAGIASPADLSGIAVLDDDRLVVVDRTSNTLLVVDRVTSDQVAFFAGEPNPVPGFADGLARGATPGLARFSFAGSTQICPTGDGRVFVADIGNHALRSVEPNGTVVTLAGAGLPLFGDGSLQNSTFDAPNGVTATCNDALVVTERGGSGFGQRVRLVVVGVASPFGGFFGSTVTLVGDGTPATSGGSASAAQVFAPSAPITTQGGDVYWVDAGSGVLRRLRDNACDCPLASDCAAAVLAPTFPAGNEVALAETDGGRLFALDATAGLLWRVSP